MIVDNQVKSLEESAFLTLEEEILDGKLKRGQTLTETALAKRLGISRTPLRAALHRLAEEGLIEISTNRGAVVVGVSAEDLLDIYQIRTRLEGLASRSAAKKISKEDIEKLRESVELSEFYIQKNDTERIKELDSDFHNLIYRASGQRHLSKILTEMHRNIKVYRKLSITVPERLYKCVEEHREILSAIESGNADLADKLTCAHVEAALKNLLSIVGNQTEKG